MTKRVKLDLPPYDLKYVDTTALLPFLSVVDNPQSLFLNIVLPGPAESNRIGNKIRVVRLQMRLYLYVDSGPLVEQIPTVAEFSRILLFQDRQPDAEAAVQLTDLLESLPLTGPGFTVVSSFQNLANIARFQILKDVSVFLPCSSAADADVSFGILPVTTVYNAVTTGGLTNAGVIAGGLIPKYTTFPYPPYPADNTIAAAITGVDAWLGAETGTGVSDFRFLTATIKANATALFGTAEIQRFHWDWDIDLDLETTFNSNNAGLASDINTNALCLMLVKSTPLLPLVTPLYFLRVQTRVFFDDR